MAKMKNIYAFPATNSSSIATKKPITKEAMAKISQFLSIHLSIIDLG